MLLINNLYLNFIYWFSLNIVVQLERCEIAQEQSGIFSSGNYFYYESRESNFIGTIMHKWCKIGVDSN
jgi:hypothetical protein